MQIDLNRIPRDRVAAVHIPDREHAQIFLDEMKARHPNKVTAWNVGLFDLDNYFDGGVCYIPHFECNMGMTYWSLNKAIEAGYTIVKWDDISVVMSDLVTEPGDISIDLLFGGK